MVNEILKKNDELLSSEVGGGAGTFTQVVDMTRYITYLITFCSSI
jgi:hypothetical protein